MMIYYDQRLSTWH